MGFSGIVCPQGPNRYALFIFLHRKYLVFVEILQIRYLLQHVHYRVPWSGTTPFLMFTTEVYVKKLASLAGLIILGQCSLLRNTFLVLFELIL